MLGNSKTKSKTVLSLICFFFYGSLSSIMPFLAPIAIKYCTDSASKIGLLFTFLPLITFSIKPLFCSLADKYNCHKIILLVFLQLTTIGYAILLILPFANLSRSINWIFYCIANLITSPSSGVVASLYDTMIMHYSVKYSQTYGSIRLWGTFSWGLFCLSVGAFDEAQNFLPKYISGIFVFIFFMIVNTLIVYLYDNEHENLAARYNGEFDLQERKKPQIINQLALAFKLYPSLSQFAFLVTVIGIVTQFHWVFYTIYITKISDHSSLLISLSTFVQCIISEIPAFIYAYRIMKAFSPAQVFNIILLTFTIRYLCYGFLIKPGYADYVLIIELTQGITFGFFACQMTSLAQDYSKKIFNNPKSNGALLDATMQGIFGACFEGFGLGLGAFISGSMVEKLGIFGTWKLGAAIAFIAFLLNNIIELIKHYHRCKQPQLVSPNVSNNIELSKL